MELEAVGVRWIDSMSFASDGTSPEEASKEFEDEEAYTLYSCGFVVFEDERGICLAGDYYPPEGSYRYCTFIPAHAIREKIRA